MSTSLKGNAKGSNTKNDNNNNSTHRLFDWKIIIIIFLIINGILNFYNAKKNHDYVAYRNETSLVFPNNTTVIKTTTTATVTSHSVNPIGKISNGKLRRRSKYSNVLLRKINDYYTTTADYLLPFLQMDDDFFTIMDSKKSNTINNKRKSNKVTQTATSRDGDGCKFGGELYVALTFRDDILEKQGGIIDNNNAQNTKIRDIAKYPVLISAEAISDATEGASVKSSFSSTSSIVSAHVEDGSLVMIDEQGISVPIGSLDENGRVSLNLDEHGSVINNVKNYLFANPIHMSTLEPYRSVTKGINLSSCYYANCSLTAVVTIWYQNKLKISPFSSSSLYNNDGINNHNIDSFNAKKNNNSKNIKERINTPLLPSRCCDPQPIHTLTYEQQMISWVEVIEEEMGFLFKKHPDKDLGEVFAGRLEGTKGDVSHGHDKEHTVVKRRSRAKKGAIDEFLDTFIIGKTKNMFKRGGFVKNANFDNNGNMTNNISNMATIDEKKGNKKQKTIQVMKFQPIVTVSPIADNSGFDIRALRDGRPIIPSDIDGNNMDQLISETILNATPNRDLTVPPAVLAALRPVRNKALSASEHLHMERMYGYNLGSEIISHSENESKKKTIEKGTIHPGYDENMEFYAPLIYLNNFWILDETRVSLNETNCCPLSLDFTFASSYKGNDTSFSSLHQEQQQKQGRRLLSPSPLVNVTLAIHTISMMKYMMFTNFDSSMGRQANLGLTSDKDKDEVKRMLSQTNPWLLVVTFTVSILHTVFETLSMKNDVQFWRKRGSEGEKNGFQGISLRTVVVNFYSQIVIFLYLLNNSESTSMLVLAPVFFGVLIEFWKLRKVMWVERVETHEEKKSQELRNLIGNDADIEENESNIDSGSVQRTETDHIYDHANVLFPVRFFFFWRYYRFAFHKSYTTDTNQFDKQAVKYLGMLLAPLLIAYSAYSMIYEEHKGWYSFLIKTNVQFIYFFSFLMMTPQIFINYKLKSVASMPWRTFIYKFLNTIIDDLFSFVIVMPTLHRISCFKDDIVFVILLYQRWVYDVDSHRNEDGEVVCLDTEGRKEKKTMKEDEDNITCEDKSKEKRA